MSPVFFHSPTWKRGVAVTLFSSAVAIISLNAASCKATPVTAVPDTGSPIKIGVSIALSGSSQGYGETVQNAIKLASQQINATGGILGRHVDFTIVDDASDTGGVIQANVQGLLDQGAVAILGPVGSSQVLAVADMIAKRNVIQISGSATSATLTSFQPMTNRYFFRTVPPDTLQARALAVFASRGPGAFKLGDGGSSGMSADGGPPSSGCRKMALIYNDDDYGTPFAAAVKTEFPAKSAGGSIVFEAKVPADVKANYNVEVAGIVAANPDCMAMIVYDPTADALIRELKKGQESTPTLPPTFFIIGTDGSFTNDLISNGRLNKADPTS
ncbi:MAG: ABC transporter substrate-binding protein, partial [Polyangiaceae bacterium]